MSDTLHAVIASVQEGSRAQKEGLKAGDTIVSVNGQPVEDLIDLNFALADEKVHLVVQWRQPAGLLFSEAVWRRRGHYYGKCRF